jgi:hypothetical protein
MGGGGCPVLLLHLRLHLLLQLHLLELLHLRNLLLVLLVLVLVLLLLARRVGLRCQLAVPDRLDDGKPLLQLIFAGSREKKVALGSQHAEELREALVALLQAHFVAELEIDSALGRRAARKRRFVLEV